MTTPITKRSTVGNKETVIPHLWSIVLAGGEGTRLAPMIKEWLGEERPKQYCTFTGTRSMLQHTVDRADLLAPPTQRVTVVGAGQEETAHSQLDGRGGFLVVQPANCNTAPGVFLPLSYVRAADPDATVVIYPSDHFVHPEAQLVQAVRHAVGAIDLLEDRLILLGIQPDGFELDYGYMQVDRYVGGYGAHSLWHVGRFVEKPEQQLAKTFAEGQVLWNTMIVVAKVQTLWKLGTKVLPSMMRRRHDEGRPSTAQHLSDHADEKFFWRFSRARVPQDLGLRCDGRRLERLGETGANCAESTQDWEGSDVSG